MTKSVRADSSIYLNNAASGFPKSRMALEAYLEAVQAPLQDVRINRDATALADLRQKVAGLIGVDAGHVFFCSDATLALNAAIQGTVGRQEHCIVDNRSHNAVLRTVASLTDAHWEVADLVSREEKLVPSRVLEKLQRDTRLVCLTHTSNVSGSIYDLASLVADIQRHSQARVLIDASQSAGSCNIADVTHADFVIFTGHKYLHGVLGAAVLVARDRLRPFIFGGTGTRSAELRFSDRSENYVEVGTPNLPAIASMETSLQEWTDNRAEFIGKVAERVEQLWEGLKRCNSLVPLGRGPGRTRNGTISCRVAMGSPEMDWAPFLYSQNIHVRGGLHCSPVHHHQLGLGDVGSLRFSVSRYTREDDIMHTLDEIEGFSRFLKADRQERSVAHDPAPRRTMHKTKGKPIRFSVHSVMPCAEAPSLVALEGSIHGASTQDVVQALCEMQWRARHLRSTGTVVARFGATLFILSSDGDYNLSHLPDEQAGYEFLEELGMAMGL